MGGVSSVAPNRTCEHNDLAALMGLRLVEEGEVVDRDDRSASQATRQRVVRAVPNIDIE